MKWQGRRKSNNMQDRRGMGTTGKVVAGGGVIGIIFVLFQLFMGGGDTQQALETLQQIQAPTGQQERPLNEDEKREGDFVATVLADTEDVWKQVFTNHGVQYREPKLVLFSQATTSRCGQASAGTGPFYCPVDETIYMDLNFFQTLTKRFGAKNGAFAVAYVIAHEVGHHIQNQMGTLDKVNRLRGTQNGQQAQIALELQADFYAGVFAHHIAKYLTKEDIEIAISAAAAVGDDNIQKRTQGYVNKESFSHGTSEQRKYWLAKGMQTGDIAQGNTFEGM